MGTKSTHRKIVGQLYPEAVKLRGEKYYDFVDNLSIEQIYHVNKELCLTEGIGDDHITITELGSYRRISSFKNMLEWEIKNWKFQEDAFFKDLGYYRCGTEYNIHRSLSGDWCRFIENDQLVYGTISSLGSHLYYHAEDILCDLINKLIPHEIHMDHLKDNRMELRVDAGGREEELKNIERRMYDYLANNLHNDISPLLTISGIIKIDDFSKPCDLDSNIIFCDVSDLKNVRFKHFLNDISKRQILPDVLSGLKDSVTVIATNVFNSELCE